MIKSSAIVVVLDNTNVVNESLIDSVYLILNRFIADCGQHDYIGFVRFDNKQVVITHKIEHSKSILKNKFDKCDLDNDCYSDLEYGLSSGLQLFEECPIEFDKSILILITSNSNNKPNFINVAEKIRESKINFNCIAIGPRADENLERIAELTNGKIYSSNCDRREFTRVFENCVLNAMFNDSQIITILDENIELQNESLEQKFNIDGKDDNQLICTISINDILPDDSDFKFELFDPDKGKMDYIAYDLELKRIQFIPSKSIPGEWTLKSTNNSSTELRINISIRYKLKDNKSIALRAQLKQVKLKYQYPPLIVVELTNGLEQFKASNIKAIIKRPDGSEFEVNLNEFNKLYSKCFEDLNGPGRYNVSIKAENIITSEKSKRLQRYLMAGCFKINKQTLNLFNYLMKDNYFNATKHYYLENNMKEFLKSEQKKSSNKSQNLNNNYETKEIISDKTEDTELKQVKALVKEKKTGFKPEIKKRSIITKSTNYIKETAFKSTSLNDLSVNKKKFLENGSLSVEPPEHENSDKMIEQSTSSWKSSVFDLESMKSKIRELIFFCEQYSSSKNSTVEQILYMQNKITEIKNNLKYSNNEQIETYFKELSQIKSNISSD